MSETARLARRAAELLAVDPVGLGGAVLRGAPGPGRDAWLDWLRVALPAGTPWRKLPIGAGEDRVLGGLDLAATLAAGRPVAAPGLLADASGGILLVPSAERLGGVATAHLGIALETGEVAAEREGLSLRAPARIAAVLLDEGQDDEGVAPALAERLAFRIRTADLEPSSGSDKGKPGLDAPSAGADALHLARGSAPHVAVDAATVEAICAAALAFGVPSLRAATQVVRAAKAAAALAGRDAVGADDVALAVALVIGPRATTLPAGTAENDVQNASEQPEPEVSEAEPEEATGMPSDNELPDDMTAQDAGAIADRLIAATEAAIPADLLAELTLAARGSGRMTSGGRAGAPRANAARGRPAGTRAGLPRRGARLALVETLRAAAPWQALRRQASPDGAASGRILVRRDDFRIARLKARSETVTIFAVDASGSAALNRLAEVKGAVELILADCYVRRDQVALIAFRGTGTELILPPTRSLTRARRALAGQPGGGGTPLAAAIEAAMRLADGVRRKGQTALVVLMTDGRANVDRLGRPGRAAADGDAADMARAFRLSGTPGLVLDIAPRPAEPVRRLAAAMGARYVPLPYADARTVSRAVRAAGSNE